jgi:hypothetical protein
MPNNSPVEKQRPAGQGGSCNKGMESCDHFSMPVSAPVVNTSSPKLWRALRKFNRNFKRIERLQEENAALLEEMKRLQGVTS